MGAWLSSAPPGLAISRTGTHRLRGGLNSFAASRLAFGGYYSNLLLTTRTKHSRSRGLHGQGGGREGRLREGTPVREFPVGLRGGTEIGMLRLRSMTGLAIRVRYV